MSLFAHLICPAVRSLPRNSPSRRLLSQPCSSHPNLHPNLAFCRSLSTPSNTPSTSPGRVRVHLVESDLEETFVKGTGPGGQKINKCRHRVQLLHLPTGIRVQCQASRSLAINRAQARKLLLAKLDELTNGTLSKRQVAIERERRKKAKKRREAAGKYGRKDETQELFISGTNEALSRTVEEMDDTALEIDADNDVEWNEVESDVTEDYTSQEADLTDEIQSDDGLNDMKESYEVEERTPSNESSGFGAAASFREKSKIKHIIWNEQ
ncbi:hypothetical protein M427DRAFT_54562 [Gonapodya prolifera JEL478]|uniref:Prokaryotic-type class I peptide chain release factors domain-containing protein n=1 Tax=Gonapodya prolifera (strain JEL478) TaxID=1344416 RepID=A0A139ALK0_GONPJ|nr:hypothetical protein M427DRAFT_54562 [Gonapodya prolifera JEL478]|eukprot:KXS17639.1 hypothetical protein M427DRAFT_54562 [Gonapodya prolifera JEL478]